MFGMMFGDVGHGGLLALAGLVRLAEEPASRIRDFGILLTFNGLSSAAFGAIYGSYFGIPAPEGIRPVARPVGRQPDGADAAGHRHGHRVDEPRAVLNIVNRLRHRGWVDGVLGKFGIMGVVFYWGALALVAKAAAIRAQGWWTLALVVFLGMPILCWALKEPLELLLCRRAGHVASRAAAWLAAIHGIAGRRIRGRAALPRQHRQLRAAGRLRHEPRRPAHGHLHAGGGGRAPRSRRPALSVLVVVLGNLVAILLEGIVASVQALRLEYYEFFGKFFSGEGKPFKPFCLAVTLGLSSRSAGWKAVCNARRVQRTPRASEQEHPRPPGCRPDAGESRNGGKA